MDGWIAIASRAAADGCQTARRDGSGRSRSRARPSIGTNDPDRLLWMGAQLQLGCRKQTIHDQVVTSNPVVHEFRIALGADHPEWRHLTLANPGRELDEYLATVVEGTQRTP